MAAGRRIGAIVTTALLCLGALLLASPSAQAASPFKIARVYYNSPGDDTFSNASINGEYVLVQNLTAQAQALTGWRVMDASKKVFAFPATTVPARGVVVLRTGKGGNSATTKYWQQGNYVWNNDRDTAYLFTPGGTLMHSCAYNNALAVYRNC